MHIVFLDAYTISPGDMDLSSLESIGEVVLHDRTASLDVLQRAQNAQILITNKVKITAEFIAQLPKLKYIIVAATGYDVVDIKAAAARNIPVSNVSGYSTTSVSQHVFAMLLAYLSHSQIYFDESKKREWSNKPDFSYWHQPIEELTDLTFGVFGMGTIGKKVAAIALAFGMKTIAYSRSPERDAMTGVTMVTMEELLSQSDVLSCHVPLNDSTKQIFNKDTFAKMKSTSILINTARGGIIHEPDLAEALHEHQIKAALLDVLSQEPPPKNHPLLGLDKCYITPHQAWASVAARRRLLHGIVQNIQGFIDGQLQNVVNGLG